VGYWNTYKYNPDTDQNVRTQRCKKLGPKSWSKFQAYKELAKYIEQPGTDEAPRPDGSVTLEVFTRTRWVPLKEGGWRSFSNAKGRVVSAGKLNAERTMNYIFGKFGHVPLDRLDKIALQSWLNGMAGKYSDSVVRHCRIYLKSILEEAVEQDYIRKNPAKKLIMLHTRVVDKITLTLDQLQAVLTLLDQKHSLLLRLGCIEALRPSELLALRWRDFDSDAGTLTIRWTIYRGVLRPYTKTTQEGSTELHLLTVALPDRLVKELMEYRGKVTNGQGTRPWTGDDHFIFSTKEGTIMHKENILHRVFRPIRKKLKLQVLNFQVLRRTMATQSQHDGSVKDIQTHLRHRNADVTAGVYMQRPQHGERGL